MLGIELGHHLTGAIGFHKADGTTAYFSQLITDTQNNGGTLILGHNILQFEEVVDMTDQAPVLEDNHISNKHGLYIVKREVKTYQLINGFSGKIDLIIMRDVLGSPVFDDGSGTPLGLVGKLGNVVSAASSKLTDDIAQLLSPRGRLLVIETLTPEGADIHLDRLNGMGFHIIDSGPKYKVLQR